MIRLSAVIVVAAACNFGAAWAESSPMLLPEPGNEPITIVCLGDSVTGVYYHTGGKAAYPEMLEIGLRRAYPQARISVINAGISGNTTQSGLDRLDRDVLGKRPQLVTISFGLNDMSRIPTEQFRENLIELARRCRAGGSRVLFCTPNAVVDTPSRPVTRLVEYCDLIRAVGRELGVPVCDQFAAGDAHRRRDPAAWRLTMSDEIHPNMAGHKRMAEELCRSIAGRDIDLDDVGPTPPALAKTWSLLDAGTPVRVLAMPPYDELIIPALRAHFPNARIEVESWSTAGKSIREIEDAAKATVRTLKPDLVVLAVPLETPATDDDQFARSFAWIMNWSLSFATQEWDCLVAHPSVAMPGVDHPRHELVRKLVRAQHLHLLDRGAVDRSPAAQILARRLSEDLLEARTPYYADKSNLLQVYDADGRLQPVKTPDDWRRRVKHVLGNMQRVMGPLPSPAAEPLAVQVVDETPLRRYVRRQITFAVEPGDRLSGYLLLPRGAEANGAKHPAMICLPGSSAYGKDAPAGLAPAADMAYAGELVERGYVCLVLDYPLLHTRDYPTDPYALGYDSATMKGIVNHRRGVDLLASLPYVDAAKIGVIGHSLGGHNALFLAAFEPRIQAVVSSCGFNVFAKHNRGDVRAWSSRYYMPRIRSRYGDVPNQIPFDFTEVLASMAPRAVFVNAPLHDEPDFEVSGVRDCVTAAMPVFRDIYRAADNLHVEYPNAGHAFPITQRMAAYAFLDRHLKARATEPVRLSDGLVAHWPLARDARDFSGHNRHARTHGVEFVGGAAKFGGRESYLEVPATVAPKFGKADFGISLKVNVPQGSDDLPGDLLSAYDAHGKRGFQLSLKTNAGVTFSQANLRNLQFSIDADRSSQWTDCGRPGDAVLAFALATHEGALYAGTCEPGKDRSGHVYRYAGGRQWIDCGAPDRSNAVTALAVYGGRLYAGTGKYRLAGSALEESENSHLGGKIYRYEGRQTWSDCGQLPGVEAVGGMVVFRGRLYASSLYKPAGFFRYEEGKKWTDCGVPDDRRVEALGVFDGHLYATSYDGGRVYRFDGKAWEDCGQLGDNTQTYSFAVYQRRLFVGTWPSGRVFRFDDVNRWSDVGRLGNELEVMGMLVHNGRLVAGSLPSAEVFEFDGQASWRRIGQLDSTPNVKYRRAWTMAEHQGRVYCSTLPSGRIYAFEAGATAAWDQEFPDGTRHIAAVKRADELLLYVDGREVARSVKFDKDQFDVDAAGSLFIGRGMNDDFCGSLSDVRLYERALTPEEILELAKPADAAAGSDSSP